MKEGIPLDEKGLKEWQQAFIDIEESIALVNKYNEKKGGKK